MKRVTAIIMLVVMLFTMIPCVSAAEAKTEVEKDIAQMLFDGKAWDPRAFLKEKNADDIFLIAVDERGFQYGGGSDDYGFYLYVYNPSKKQIMVNSEKNMVQMAVAWENDRATEFEKFELKLVSVSKGNEYLKYKVVDHYSSVDVLNMQQRLALYQKNKSKRIYEISGIEFLHKGATNATEYAYGCKAVLTGYEAGRAQSGTNADTKKLTYVASRSLKLGVHQVYWRSQTGKDVGYRNQINGAYFAVSNSVWDNYERLYNIKCTWEEYRTKPMIVTDDETLYETLLSYVGMRIRPGEMNLDYSLYSGYDIIPGVPNIHTYNYAYNVKESVGIFNQYQVKNPITQLNWLLPPVSEIKLNAEVVSVDDVLQYYHRNKDKLSLLTNEVDEGRTVGRNYVTINLEGTDEDGNPMFPLDNYLDHHTKWEAFWAYTWFNGGKSFDSVDLDEDYGDTFEAITVFRKGDDNSAGLLSDSLAEIADNHFLQTEEMAEEFCNFVKTAHANDETVVLFRYAETDYFSETLSVVPAIEGHAVISWQTMFLDFDVIQLGFHDKQRNLVIVPVSNDPEDVGGGVQDPNTSTDSDLVTDQLKDQFKDQFKDPLEEFWEKMKKMLEDILHRMGIILLVVLVISFIPLVTMIVSKLGDVISSLGTGEKKKKGKPRSSKTKKKK